MDFSKLSDEDLLKIDKGEPVDIEQLTTETVEVTEKAPTPEESAEFERQLAENPSMLEQVGDVFTGNLRKTEETEALPDWAGMPELNEFTLNSFQTALGTMMTNPEETVGIIKAQYPDVQMRTDYKGNFILKSSIDGKEYAIKAGFQPSDIPRAAGSLLAFTPAGGARTLAGQAAAGAGTQATVEGIEASSGGDFSGTNVAVAGSIPLVGGLLSKLKNAVLGKPTPATNVAEETATTPTATPEQTLEEMSITAKQAGTGSKSKVEELSTQVAPDVEKVEAAKRLGIEQYLQPDHVTTNQMYRELAQAVKSMPASVARAQELQNFTEITKRVDDMLAKIGADDVSVISDVAKKDLQALHDKSFQEAGKLYDELRAGIPATTRVNADNVLNTIKARADELGGIENLSAPEKLVLKKLSPKDGVMPTYALLDDVRRDIVAAKFKGQGAFKDADDRILDILNNGLRQDQKAVAEQFGLGDTFELAQKTAGTYKSMQDDLKSLFGKDMAESIVGDISASTSALAKGDTSKFIKLLGAIKYLPKEQQQQIVASGLKTAFGKRLRNDTINFGNYADWYRGIKGQKQAYTALMANLPPETARSLDDLYKVSDGIAKASLERIGTGRINIVKDIIKDADTTIGKFYEAVKGQSGKLMLGGTADIIGTGGAGMAFAIGSALAKKKDPAMQTVDKLIASPQFIQMATNPTAQNVRRLAYDKKFIEFMKNINKNATLEERERFILSTIQAEKPKE